jgi:hypothetical protein
MIHPYPGVRCVRTWPENRSVRLKPRNPPTRFFAYFRNRVEPRAKPYFCLAGFIRKKRTGCLPDFDLGRARREKSDPPLAARGAGRRRPAVPFPLPPEAANRIVRCDAYRWRHQAMPALS